MSKRTLSTTAISFPATFELHTFTKSVKELVLHMANIFGFSKTTSNPRFNRSSSFLPLMFRNNKSNVFKIVAGMVVLVGVVLGLRSMYHRNSPKMAASQQETLTMAESLATQELNREFVFPLRDAELEEIGSLTYNIVSAELRDEIIVKGQRARTVANRAYLILNLEISNDFEQGIEIDSRDYVRLIVNGNQDKPLAPEIHNDPVEVQAISVKNTRLGFLIDRQVDSLQLQVGEINGEKQTIDLTL